MELWPDGLQGFVESLQGDFPHLDPKIHEEVTVVDRIKGVIPNQITVRPHLRMRLFDEKRATCVQVGRDSLAVNLIKQPDGYPGFSTLREKSLEMLKAYQDSFQPAAVLKAALHYTDMVTVPTAGLNRFRIEDYFAVGLQVPDDDAWPLSHVAIDLVVPLQGMKGDADHLAFGFRREQPEEGHERFRLDWHSVCTDLETLDHDVLSGRLEEAHTEIKERFRGCFTDRSWAIFGEEEES